jgi:hypothetical protein
MLVLTMGSREQTTGDMAETMATIATSFAIEE